MSRLVVWSATARADYLGIVCFIARQNPNAAERIVTRIEAAAQKLGQRATGRPGRVTGTYEKTLPGLPYIIAYETGSSVTGEGFIAILHIVHSARHWPSEEWPED